MKIVRSAVLLLGLVQPAGADVSIAINGKLRLADAAGDACYANCSSDNASCKRACPTTFSTPCLSACDSQLQTCRQGCQRK
jgi:hypothetical protein